jgi:TolB protein
MPLTNATVQQAHNYNPQWSPDGTKIVFHSSRNLDLADEAHPNLTLNLWLVNADSTGLMPLTNTPAGAHSYNPQWSPDGTKIVFHSSRKLDGTTGMNLASNLWRVNVDGTGLIALTNTATPGTDSADPQWSPDGTKIVFRSRRTLAGTDALGMVYNIWWVNADGTGLTPLTRATAWGADCYNPQLKR